MHSVTIASSDADGTAVDWQKPGHLSANCSTAAHFLHLLNKTFQPALKAANLYRDEQYDCVMHIPDDCFLFHLSKRNQNLHYMPKKLPINTSW